MGRGPSEAQRHLVHEWEQWRLGDGRVGRRLSAVDVLVVSSGEQWTTCLRDWKASKTYRFGACECGGTL